jgi:hypothetical protein
MATATATATANPENQRYVAGDKCEISTADFDKNLCEALVVSINEGGKCETRQCRNQKEIDEKKHENEKYCREHNEIKNSKTVTVTDWIGNGSRFKPEEKKISEKLIIANLKKENVLRAQQQVYFKNQIQNEKKEIEGLRTRTANEIANLTNQLRKLQVETKESDIQQQTKIAKLTNELSNLQILNATLQKEYDELTEQVNEYSQTAILPDES